MARCELVPILPNCPGCGTPAFPYLIEAPDWVKCSKCSFRARLRDWASRVPTATEKESLALLREVLDCDLLRGSLYKRVADLLEKRECLDS